MSESTKLMSFEEFRAAGGGTFTGVVQQQQAFFRDEAAANAMLEPGAVPLAGWAVWDGNAFVPAKA